MSEDQAPKEPLNLLSELLSIVSEGRSGQEWPYGLRGSGPDRSLRQQTNKETKMDLVWILFF